MAGTAVLDKILAAERFVLFCDLLYERFDGLRGVSDCTAEDAQHDPPSYAFPVAGLPHRLLLLCQMGYAVTVAGHARPPSSFLRVQGIPRRRLFVLLPVRTVIVEREQGICQWCGRNLCVDLARFATSSAAALNHPV